MHLFRDSVFHEDFKSNLPLVASYKKEFVCL